MDGAGTVPAMRRSAAMAPLSPLLQQSLRLGLASLITAAIALWSDRIAFVWYPLLAVIFVIDDNDELTVKAALARVLGTASGGLVAFLVHTIMGGWPAVLVSLLLTVPLLRLLGWQGGLSTAVTISLMFLLIPHYTALNWDYVFNRTVDTSVGIVVALLTALLFWPKNRLQRIGALERQVHTSLQTQLAALTAWALGRQTRPAPLSRAEFTARLLALEQLVQQEQAGHARHLLRQARWRQRLLIWQTIHHHWVQFERLLGQLPAELAGEPAVAALASQLQRALQQLQAPASGDGPLQLQPASGEQTLPSLLLLSLEEEHNRLRRALLSLQFCERSTLPRTGSTRLEPAR